ncbi:MAG: MMPL family transporter [Candidatus Omnitrophota bacterium]|jgi:predicted exporter
MDILFQYYSRLFDAVRRYRFVIGGITAALIILSAAGVFFIRYDNDIARMLPADQALVRIMGFFREAHFSDKVMLDVRLVDERAGEDALHAAVDSISAGLTDSSFVRKVTASIDQPEVMRQIPAFFGYLPGLFSVTEAGMVQERLTSEGVHRSLAGLWRQAMIPGASSGTSFARIDPLGIAAPFWRNLEQLTGALGYEVLVRRNHLTSRDGKHALIIVETPVRMTDGFGSQRLLAYLEQATRVLPEGIAVDVIAGHRHTVSNEKVIKGDVARTSIAASLVFLIIFVFTYRDPRAIVFFIIPACAVLVAINLCGLIFGRLSAFVAGMGAVIVGIADDYGIHVYTAVRAARRRDAVKDVARPLLVAGLITMSVFAAFFFSSVEAYRELALFAIISIACCLLFVLFLFPYLIDLSLGSVMAVPAGGRSRKVLSDKAVLVSWAGCLLICGFLSTRVTFSNDMSRFDGSEASILSAERRFESVWAGKSRPGFLVVSGSDMEDALAVNERVFAEAERAAGKENISGIAVLLPSSRTRQENALRWKSFWSADRRAQVKNLLQQEGGKYDFSASAFEPFLQSIAVSSDVPPQPPAFVQELSRRFIVSGEHETFVFSSFRDQPRIAQEIQRSIEGNPRVFVASRRALEKAMAAAVNREARLIAFAAVGVVFLLTVILLKDLVMTVIALSCVVSAFLAMAAGFVIAGVPVSAPALIASMVVGGLCIDYGVFMLYSCKHSSDTETAKAIWVSVLTTLAGALSLLVARHPVLFTIGFTLSVGLCAGCIAAQAVVPVLYRRFTPLENAGSLTGFVLDKK